MKKLLKRFRDALRVLTAEEYFVTTANVDYSHCTPGVYSKVGPVKYKYYANTDRKMFYTFVNQHINNL